MGFSEQLRSESPRFASRKNAEGKVATLRSAGVGHRATEQLKNGADIRLLAAIHPDEKRHRGIGPAQQLGDDHAAVEIAPLQIVDAQHQRNAVAEPGQQLAQGRCSTAPDFLIAGAVLRALRGIDKGRHVLKDSKHSDQRTGVTRHDLFC